MKPRSITSASNSEQKTLHLPSLARKLPDGWHWMRLDEVCSGIFDCPHSTPVLAAEGAFLARSQDILSGTFRFESAARVSEETYRERTARADPAYGDLLYSREGTYFGIAAEVPKDSRVCLGQRMVLLRPDFKRVNFRFLRYWLNSPVLAAHIHGHRDGTVAERLNLPTIRSLPIPVAPMSQQAAIASVLGGLDDQIELNRCINETLAAMARGIFKSWFADFDPVRAKAEGRPPSGMDPATAALFPDSFEDSSLGKIPRRWKLTILAEVLFELVSGSRPKGGAVQDGVPSIGAENIIGLGRYEYSKDKFIPHLYFEQLKRKGADVRRRDILLYKDGAQIGRKAFFDCDFPYAQCAINEHVLILRAKNGWDQRFLYFWLDQQWMTDEIITLNSNSAQPGINQAGVRRLPLLRPSDTVIQRFDNLVEPLTDRVFLNCHQSRTLAGIRDALLPKLISGALRVNQIDMLLLEKH